MIENEGKAAAWISDLRARGVTVTLGPTNRIRLHPARAYAALSDEELLTLRHCRQEIKQVVRDGPLTYERAMRPPFESESSVANPGEPAKPSSEPEPCKWCNRAPCIGPEHPAFYALHPEAARQREDERLTEEMRACAGRPHRLWDGLL